MQTFRRRFYNNPAALWRDMAALVAQRRAVGSMMRGEVLHPVFRERLMMAVTAVNGCRYCSYYHARQALKQGMAPSEIKALGDGIFQDCPDQELPAVLYAQHWADTDAHPDPAARERLLAIYGPTMVDAIELALCTIRIGNLLGNTGDYALYRLSFGNWGQLD